MEKSEYWKYIDHTLLRADAAWEEIRKLCDEAARYGAASVCVPPSYVKRIKGAYPERPAICTVIGFPLGYQCLRVKVEEAKEAAADGAAEIDMVINIGDVKNGDFRKIEDEIGAIRAALPGKILKVIIETCYLDETEKIALCGAVTGAGADYIKTSTGFGSAGAVLEDIALFKKHIGSGVKIKAAGGITTLEEIAAFVEAGCARIGTSRGVRILG